ncbi:MAG: hypothetical protein Q7S01_02115 [bacterium]|nr:hypothetical protein [bacterium]
MTTQVVFNIDSKVKARAMERAKREGIPFASVLKLATKAFAEGQFSIGIVDEILPQKMRLLERESKLLDKGKGRRFSSVKDALAFVEHL